MKFLKRFFITLTISLSLMVVALFYKGYGTYTLEKEYFPVENVLPTLKVEIPNYTEIEDISINIQKAMVAVEDHRFYDRFGIDFIALGRAVITNLIANDLIEGGSTITQQLIKNVYFDHSQNLFRKIAEFYFIFDFETHYSKDEILEMYLNVIYYGDGYYGIHDATVGYFNKKPADVDLFESSLVVGLTNAPSIYQLSTGFDLALNRQRHVLKRMYDNHDIDKKTYEGLLIRQDSYQNPKENASE